MSECSTQLMRTVPLYKAVMAAIVDSFEDIGKTQQTYSHWAARKLKELNRQTLLTGKRTVLLAVNRNTNTATLPPDFHEELFVGVMANGKKVPLKLRTDLVDEKNVEDIPCEDKCEKCNQDKAICEDLTITESTELVVVNDTVQEQTIIKKLYPDGSYWLETRIPIWDIASQTIVYTTQKQFIATLSLKSCGCIDDTEENIETIRCCNYDVYCQYYAGCDNSCNINYGGYQIFEETGLIAFDKIGKFTKVYMEYRGFMPKKNGQYQIPEVAFETIVEWIKFRNIDGRRSSPNVDKRWRHDMYKIARGNMEKEMGQISLDQIFQAITMIPKFDVDEYVYEPQDCVTQTTTVTTSATDECTSTTTAVCPPASGTKIFTPFSIAQVVGVGGGAPVAGTNTYQDNKLIGALGVNMIVVNNTTETIQAGQFSLDTVTGILTRYQGDGVTANNWFAGDILIVPTFFKLV